MFDTKKYGDVNNWLTTQIEAIINFEKIKSIEIFIYWSLNPPLHLLFDLCGYFSF